MIRHRMASDGDAKLAFLTSQILPLGAADIDWGSSDAGLGELYNRRATVGALSKGQP